MSNANATLTPAAERRAASLIYLASFSFAISLGSMQVLVPLYGLHLGYEIEAVGVILAAQAVLPLASRFFAGAIADTFGDRYVLWFSFGTMCMSAIVFGVSGLFGALIAAQTLQGLARSTYWTVTQSYATRINPDRAAYRLGRLSATGNGGNVLGTAASGILAGTLGYEWAFGVVAGAAFLGLLGSIALPMLPRPGRRRGFKGALAPIPAVAKSRSMGMAGISAFFGSTSAMLGVILIIPYLKEIDYSDSETGFARTLTAVGALTAGLLFGTLMARLGLKRLQSFAFALQGLVYLTVPLLSETLWSGYPVMYVYGVFMGLMGSLYPMTASTYSRPEHRGTAMAYAGQFWGLAQLIVPIAFGYLAAAVGIGNAIYVGGASFIALGLIVPLVFPWVTRHGVR